MRLFTLLIRTSLILVAIAAFGTAAIWKWKPEWVVKVNGSARGYYINHYLEPINSARKTIGTDPAGGADELELALERMPPVFKKDRLFVPTQSATLVLSKTYLKLGQIEKARSLAKVVLDADSHDLKAHIAWIDCLMAAETTKTKGIREIHQLVTKFPGHQEFAHRSIQACIEAGDREAAAEVALKYVGAPGSGTQEGMGLGGKWFGWWAKEDRFSSKARTKAEIKRMGAQIEIRFRIPKGNSFLRLDLPPNCIACIVVHSATGSIGGETFDIPTNGKLKANKDLAWDGKRLVATGNPDPWFTMPLPPKLAGKACEILIAGDLVIGSLPWLMDVLQTEEAIALAYAMAQGSRPDIFERTKQLHLRDGMSRGWSFSWQGTQGRLKFEQTQDEPLQLRFQTEIVVPRTGGSWTLLPPQVNGWQLGGLRVEALDGSTPPTCNPEPVLMELGESGSWIATEFKSQWSLNFAAWQDAPKNKTITLSGWIQ